MQALHSIDIKGLGCEPDVTRREYYLGKLLDELVSLGLLGVAPVVKEVASQAVDNRV